MRHLASQRFWRLYNDLPSPIRELADKSFELLAQDSRHPSLHFKKVGRFWSARVGPHYRALAVEDGNDLVWFWIGNHDDYDRLVGQECVRVSGPLRCPIWLAEEMLLSISGASTGERPGNMRKEYDFSKAKRAKDVPHLAKLQAEAKGKSRITIMLDNDLLLAFRARAKAEGIGYQTLINQTLRQAIGTRPVDEETLRKILREELASR